MDTLASTTKRKKRKTRKCLDELRKRSRTYTDGSGDTLIKKPWLGKIGETVTNLNGMKPNNCITSNRLTLAMFPKAIMSETITRPIIPEFKQNANKIVKNERPQSTVTSSSHKIKELTDSSESDVIRNSDEESVKSAFGKCNSMGIQRNSGSEDLSHREDSPGSPMIHPADTDISPNGETLTTPTTPTTQSSGEGNGYQLYEEFMNEIPTYIKEIAPALINDDVMKKTRTFLHNIYMEGCHRECEDNILQCIKNSVSTQHRPFTTRVAISQNSMEYIKDGYSWRRSEAHKLNRSVGAAGSTHLGSVGPHLGSVGTCTGSAGTCTGSAGTCTDSATSVLSRRSLIHDTPEYTYYAHKLHQ